MSIARSARRAQEGDRRIYPAGMEHFTVSADTDYPAPTPAVCRAFAKQLELLLADLRFRRKNRIYPIHVSGLSQTVRQFPEPLAVNPKGHPRARLLLKPAARCPAYFPLTELSPNTCFAPVSSDHHFQFAFHQPVHAIITNQARRKHTSFTDRPNDW